jgi:hypothetical protein
MYLQSVVTANLFLLHLPVVAQILRVLFYAKLYSYHLFQALRTLWLCTVCCFSMCMTELFVKLLIHNLAEVVYDAELAQIT